MRVEDKPNKIRVISKRIVPVFRTSEDPALFAAEQLLIAAIYAVQEEPDITAESLRMQFADREVAPEFLERAITQQLVFLENPGISGLPRVQILSERIRKTYSLVREAYGLGGAKPDVQS